MTNTVKAGFITAGILVVGAVVATVVEAILSYLTPDQVINVVAIGSILFLVWCMYQVVLSRLDYDEKLKNLNESIKKQG